MPGRTLIQSIYPLDDEKNDENNNKSSNNNNNNNGTNLIQFETSDKEIIKCSLDRINDSQCFLNVNIGTCQLNDILLEENADSQQIELNNGDFIFLGQNKNSLFLFLNQFESVNKSERKQFSLFNLFKPCEDQLNQHKLTITELKKQIQDFL